MLKLNGNCQTEVRRSVGCWHEFGGLILFISSVCFFCPARGSHIHYTYVQLTPSCGILTDIAVSAAPAGLAIAPPEFLVEPAASGAVREAPEEGLVSAFASRSHPTEIAVTSGIDAGAVSGAGRVWTMF